jgi:AraC-type DNA-binding domain-containing proteins
MGKIHFSAVDFQRLQQYRNNSDLKTKEVVILEEVIAEMTGKPYVTDFYGISYCLEGTCQVRRDSGTYSIGPGQLFILRPGEIHYIDSIHEFEAIHIAFKKEYIQCNFAPHYRPIMEHPIFKHEANNLINIRESDRDKISRYILDISLQRKGTGIFSALILESMITTLVYEICNLISLETNSDINPSSRKYQIYESFEKLLEEYHMKERSVHLYAEKLHISPGYLNEIVKKRTGKSALNVIHDYIILKAKILLTHSNYNVSEITSMLHFEDTSTFIRFFRKRTLLSPLKFRKGA